MQQNITAFFIKAAGQIIKEFSASAGTAVYRAAHTAAVRLDTDIQVFQDSELKATIKHLGSGQTEVSYPDNRVISKKRRVKVVKQITAAQAEPEPTEPQAEVSPYYHIKQTPTGKFLIQDKPEGAYKFISKNSEQVQAFLASQN